MAYRRRRALATRAALRRLMYFERVRGNPPLMLDRASEFSNLRRFRPSIQVRRIK